MQPRTYPNFLRLPQILALSLLLAMMLTFTACDSGDGDVESDRLEEGVGGEDGNGDDEDDDDNDDNNDDDDD